MIGHIFARSASLCGNNHLQGTCSPGCLPSAFLQPRRTALVPSSSVSCWKHHMQYSGQQFLCAALALCPLSLPYVWYCAKSSDMTVGRYRCQYQERHLR